MLWSYWAAYETIGRWSLVGRGLGHWGYALDLAPSFLSLVPGQYEVSRSVLLCQALPAILYGFATVPKAMDHGLNLKSLLL